MTAPSLLDRRVLTLQASLAPAAYESPAHGPLHVEAKPVIDRDASIAAARAHRTLLVMSTVFIAAACAGGKAPEAPVRAVAPNELRAPADFARIADSSDRS